MKYMLSYKVLVFIFLMSFFGVCLGAGREGVERGRRVSFVENAGQWDSRVCYEAQVAGGAVFAECGRVTVALRGELGHPAVGVGPVGYHAYRMVFVGGGDVRPEGEGLLGGYSNFFLGKDAGRWRSGVRSFGVVRYRGLYEGVDLEVYGEEGALKYNFVVAAGADAGVVVVEYEGVDGLRVDGSGSLVVSTTVRDVTELRPYAYQVVEGEEVEVASRWRVKGRRAWVEVGEYDRGRELVVDPMLIFSTYTGSTADNWGTTATYDSEKNAYTAGLVFNVGYPVSTGAYQEVPGGGVDVGVFKFDSTGEQRLFATYLGGGAADMPHSLYVNGFDELLVFGTTGSSDFPTTEGAYGEVFRGGSGLSYESLTIGYPSGSDIFVCRLSADGQRLEASTLVGGTGNDGLNFKGYYNNGYGVLMQGNDSLYYNYGDGARGEIVTDDLNNVYVGSTTMSADFPTTGGCLQAVSGGGQDGVVFKLDYNLRNLLWSTYLGGSGDDAVYSVDVDGDYNLLVCGGTNSVDFPVTDSAWQVAYGGGGADGFVGKVSYGGERLMGMTYVGLGGYDQLYFVRAGRRDEVFVFGQTEPTGDGYFMYNAGYGVMNSGMLLMRLLPDLSGREWSTLFGTPGRINLSPTAFAADVCNRVYAAGWGRDFVGYGSVRWGTLGTTGMETTAGAWCDSTDGQDFYILSVDENCQHLEYATFFGEPHRGADNNFRGGGDHVDGGTSRFDKLATLYQSVCASCGGFGDFPVTAGAWSEVNGSTNCNNALFRFNVTDDFPVAEFVPPVAGCAPYTVRFKNTGRGEAFVWDFGDGGRSTERNPTHTYAEGGRYEVMLVALMPGGCTEADTQRHVLHVVGGGGRFEELTSCAERGVQIGLQPRLGVTYEWLTGGVSDGTIANPWVRETGQYVLRVSAPGCAELDTFDVTAYRLVDTLMVTGPRCHGDRDGSARVVLGEGVDLDSVTVTVTVGGLPQGAPTVVGDTLVYGGLPEGVVVMYHARGYGCDVSGWARVPTKAEPTYTKEVEAELCGDSCEAWVHVVGGEGVSVDTLLTGLCEGVYVLELANDEGCPFADTTRVVRNRSLDGFAAWADRYDIVLGEAVTLTAGEVAGASYRWTGGGEIASRSSRTTEVVPEDTLTVYVVTARSGGCEATATVRIRAKAVSCGAPDFVIPNAFTPNGDGVNDVLDLTNTVLSELDFALFNRWGECVFRCQEAGGCQWDGVYRNKQCLPGVYTYTCHIKCHNGEENDFKGDITLIR